MDLNKVTLIGRTTKEIETSTIQSTQWSVTNFTLATNRKYTSKNGELTDEVEYHKCVAYGKSAEVLAEHVSKWGKLYLEWRLKTNKRQDKDKIERSRTEVIVEHFIFLDTKKI
jgi:single-strand DNA-binding protein